MATSLDSFASEVQLATSAGDITTTAGNQKKFIGNFTLTNTSNSNVEVTLWRLSSSTTATTGSGGNWIWKGIVPAEVTVQVGDLVGHVLDLSMKIQGKADTADVINVDISGTIED